MALEFYNNIDAGEFTLPTADGTSGQVLETNGSGTVSWTSLPVSDNYGSWNLKTGGIQRTTVTSGGDLDIVGGTNTTVGYSAGGVVTINSSDTTYMSSDFDHDALTNYVAAEHVDWTVSQGATNIHADNFVETDPIFNASDAAGITAADIDNWNTAYGFGNHGTQGYVKDSGNYEVNVIATSTGTADTIDYAMVGAAADEFRLMSDGAELSLCNDTWADRNAVTHPKAFFHVNPLGTVNSAIGVDGKEMLSLEGYITGDAMASFTNSSASAGDNMHLAVKSTNDAGIKLYGSSATGEETARIESIEDGNYFDITNYDYGQFRLANAQDRPFLFYWGDGSGVLGDHTNEHATVGVRFNKENILVDGTNPTNPQFSFLDDNDCGMYLADIGEVAFKVGGTKTFGVPPTVGSNAQVLQTNGAGQTSWVDQQDTTYTAGSGLNLTGGVFSVKIDLRNDVQYIGSNSSTYIDFTSATYIRSFVGLEEEFRLTGTDAHFKGDVYAFSATLSDARFKDEVETIENASDKVAQLRGVEYVWNEGARKGKKDMGLIAQEVEAVIPEVVHHTEMPLVEGAEEGTEYATVDYEKLVALLIESNKEQQGIIAEMGQRIADLERKTKEIE